MDRRLTYLGLAGYALIGTAAVLIPSIMPAFTEEFTAAGVTLATIGLIFPARSLGGMVGSLPAGVISDRIGRHTLVWWSALILAVALALTALAAQWALFVVGFVLISAAQGALSTGINAMIADANRAARGKALNTLHAVYGAGAAVSPLVIGYLLARGLGWRWALGLSALIWLSYAVIAYLAPRAEAGASPAVRAAESAWSWGHLREGSLAALFAVAFIYNGVAYSLLGWVAVFMQQSAGFSTFFSVAMISVFYVALTIGRALCAAYAERLGYAGTLLVLAWGITLTYPLVVLGGDAWVVVVGVFLTGLSLSGLFPTALAFGARLYPEQTGAVTGMLNVAMTLGAMVPPLWTGLFAARWGLQVALGINFILVPPLILLALFLGRRQAHFPAEPAALDPVR
jgi:FHS family glucose/mannose:H+ symporter-like MFS transporter